MPSLTSDPRDVTVLPADTFQPVNWIGISEVIFHQVEKTKKKKKNKQKTTRQQRKEKTKQTKDKERQKTHSNQSTGLASHSSSFTRCSSIFDKKHIWQRAYLKEKNVQQQQNFIICCSHQASLSRKNTGRWSKGLHLEFTSTIGFDFQLKLYICEK